MTKNEIVEQREQRRGLPVEKDLNTIKYYAEMVYNAGLLPDSLIGKSTSKDQIIAKVSVVMLKGYELDISPMQAIAEVGVINGIPVISGKLMLALIYRDVPTAELHFVQMDTQCCKILARRKPNHKFTPFTYTIEEAISAGLLKTSWAWKSYPRQMLKWRAVANMARTIFPDVIMGCYIPDEIPIQTTQNSTLSEKEQLKSYSIQDEADLRAMANTLEQQTYDAEVLTPENEEVEETILSNKPTESSEKKAFQVPTFGFSPQPVPTVKSDIPVPVKEVPKIEIPPVNLPIITPPKVETPKVEVPKIEPKVEVPKVETPKIEQPKVDPPKMEVPKLDLPKITQPKIEVPKVETPKVEPPKVEQPKVESKPTLPTINLPTLNFNAPAPLELKKEIVQPKPDVSTESAMAKIRQAASPSLNLNLPKIEQPKVETPKVEQPKPTIPTPIPALPKVENVPETKPIETFEELEEEVDADLSKSPKKKSTRKQTKKAMLEKLPKVEIPKELTLEMVNSMIILKEPNKITNRFCGSFVGPANLSFDYVWATFKTIIEPIVIANKGTFEGNISKWFKQITHDFPKENNGYVLYSAFQQWESVDVLKEVYDENVLINDLAKALLPTLNNIYTFIVNAKELKPETIIDDLFKASKLTNPEYKEWIKRLVDEFKWLKITKDAVYNLLQ